MHLEGATEEGGDKTSGALSDAGHSKPEGMTRGGRESQAAPGLALRRTDGYFTNDSQRKENRFGRRSKNA
jgi:hypothetical protein